MPRCTTTSSPGTSCVVDAELVDHQRAQVVRHAGVDREMDRDPAAAALQRGLVGAHEVLGLFLELDAGVADQAEHAAALQGEAGEQPVEEDADQVLEQDEADARSRAGGRGRQADEALDHRRQRDQRLHDVLVLGAVQLAAP